MKSVSLKGRKNRTKKWIQGLLFHVFLQELSAESFKNNIRLYKY